MASRSDFDDQLFELASRVNSLVIGSRGLVDHAVAPTWRVLLGASA